jgi:hypothetical protein
MRPLGTKAALSPARRRLIELFQQLNFGRVESLNLIDGEPVFEPPPRVVREIKFGGENGPRPERDAVDFSLKSHVVELLRFFDQLGEGTIETIEIRYGLPFRLIYADADAN